MRRITHAIIAFIAIIAAAQVAQAQVFYTQDFSGGFPAGWTTSDGSPNGVVWTHCPAPGSGCPLDLYGRPAFASPTASNGFMLLDSDAAGDIPSQHISRLTTGAINCSAANQVFAIFNNYVGVFEVPSDGNVLLRVSTDNTNWTEFNFIPGLSVSNRFSANPHKAVVNISSVAANKATVYLQWEWTGRYEYWWMLDDVSLTSQDPTPANDLKMGAFFYPVSSFATPVSQIATDTFAFFGFVSNKGIATQNNVELKAEVIAEDGSVVFQDSASVASLEPGVLDSVIELPNRFAPELPEGLYTIKYTTSSSNGVDSSPADNTDGDDFFVSDLVFSKENGPTGALRPGSGGDYAAGNLYSMSSSSLENYQAIGFEFSAATNPDFALADAVATIYLFKVNDDIEPGFDSFDGSEFFSSSLEIQGTNEFDFPDGAANYTDYAAEIIDINSSQPGVKLQAGARYFAVVGYSDASNVVFHAYSDETSHDYFVSSMIYSDQWYLGGFGADYNPVIRMYISLVSTTDEHALPESVMNVFPNPAKDVVNLDIAFDEPTDASITIADLTGRVIKMEDRSGLTNETLTYQLPQLASGTYLARIATKTGTKTKKFIVAK